MKTIKRLTQLLISTLFMVSYLSSSFVSAASPDHYPNDPYLGTSWQFAKVGIDTTWDAIDNNNEIVIAVLDTGLDVNLTDLAERITTGYDFLRNTADMIDPQGHGTMVSSTIAAVANNGIGIAGAAGTANVKIAPYRIGDATLNNDAVNAAILDAANREEVRIINLSIGSNDYHAGQAAAIAHAVSQGKIIIAAAGNHGAETAGIDPYYYPASYPGVISVGSLGLDGQIAAFSQLNDAVDLYAPGESLMVLRPDNGYGWEDGTSFSAAIVSGICANLLALDPSLTANEVESLLIETALIFGETGDKLVQADQALDVLKSRRAMAYIHEHTSLAINLWQLR